jgi:hypothetical protein
MEFPHNYSKVGIFGCRFPSPINAFYQSRPIFATCQTAHPSFLAFFAPLIRSELPLVPVIASVFPVISAGRSHLVALWEYKTHQVTKTKTRTKP